MRSVRFFLPVVLLTGLIGVFLLRMGTARDPSVLPSALIGRPAPDFALPPLDGRQDGFARADLVAAGQGPTLVNIFASWCIPCLAEHPLITDMAASGVRVMGINYRDRDPDATRWLDRHGNPYMRIGADRDARVALDWGVAGVPETFIVDAAGLVRYKHVGPLTREIVARDIAPRLRSLANE